jgi:hypothetical protein
MKPRATHLECSLSCPWKDTSHCLRHVVKESVVLCGRLGSAQLAGVQSIYYPHPLPPCVSPDGSLHWDHREDAAEPVLPLWGHDGPAL